MPISLQQALQALERAADYSFAHAKPVLPAPVVTVSRSMGSGGTQVAQALAKRLDIPCYSRQILDEVAQRLKTSPDLLSRLHEQDSGTIAAHVYSMFTGQDVVQDAYLKALTTVIRAYARQGAVIVGRAAHLVLADTKALRLRFTCSDEVAAARIANNSTDADSDLAQSTGVGNTDQSSLEKVRHSNAARARFMKTMFQSRYDLPSVFDAIFNTDHLEDVGALVEVSVGLLRIRDPQARIPN